MKCIWQWKWIGDPYEKDSEYNKVNERFQKALKENPNARALSRD